MAVIIHGIDIPKKHYMNGYYISDDGKVFDVSRKNVIGKAVQISSTEPEWKKGKWVDDGTELGCCCSECGTTLDDYFDGSLHEICLSKIPNFCPSCGADMRGDSE